MKAMKKKEYPVISAQGASRRRVGVSALALPAATSSLTPSLSEGNRTARYTNLLLKRGNKGGLMRKVYALSCLMMLSACGDYVPEPKQMTWSDTKSEAVYPEHCPDWRHSASVNFDNSVASNWGCASAMNFGHMVANPHDLKMGRGGAKTGSESSVRAVERLNKGEITQKTADFAPVTTE